MSDEQVMALIEKEFRCWNRPNHVRNFPWFNRRKCLACGAAYVKKESREDRPPGGYCPHKGG